MLKNFRLYSLSSTLQQLFSIIYGFEFLPRYSRKKKLTDQKLQHHAYTIHMFANFFRFETVLFSLI